jgi:hypothetical protein
MNRHLLTDYFARDLTEQEDEELAFLLKNSPADAEHFADLAAQDSIRMGLGRPGRGRLVFVIDTAVGLLAATALGIATYMFFNAGREATPSRPAAAAPPVHSSAGDSDSAGLRPKANPPQAQTVPPHLEVLVDTSGRPGFSIRLLPSPDDGIAVAYDAQGKPLGRLESVGPSTWFWNGNDAAGNQVSPGSYEIRVYGHGWRYSKWVEIEKR